MSDELTMRCFNRCLCFLVFAVLAILRLQEDSNTSDFFSVKSHQMAKPTIPQMSEGYLTCLDNGRVYRDGETFASTTTSLQPQQPSQCVQCVCQEGRILCRLKTCKLTTCSKTISTPDDCCQACQEAENVNNKDVNSQEHVLVTFTITDESIKGRNSTNDCLSGGQIYSQGATWHPVIGPLGQMECVICKCQLGKVECSRLSCKETKSCSELKQIPGRCCPVCISEEISEDATNSKEIPQQNPLPNETREKLCIPKKRDALVYRSQASHRLSGYYQYAFQTQNDHGTIRLLSWTVKAEKMADFSKQHLSTKEFGVLRTTFRFTLLGATKTKLMDRFIKRSKSLADHCVSGCHRKISRLETVLRLKEISRRSHCSKREKVFGK